MKTILVPTDCSALSARALRYADRIAQRTGARVVAVYGERFSARIEGEGVAASLASHDDLEWMTASIRQKITEVLGQTLTASTQRRIVIADARAEEAIIDVADRGEADLIVMGTHDRNRIMRAVLGSVTDGVLRDTHRPVLILREHNDVAEEEPIRRIVCPFRDSPASRAALENAVVLAKAFDAEAVLVQMVQSDRAEPLPAWFEDVVPAEFRSSIRRLVLGADAGGRLVALADGAKADLIVLGTSHRRFSEETGAPAAQVVRTAHCPVLAVTAPPE